MKRFCGLGIAYLLCLLTKLQSYPEASWFNQGMSKRYFDLWNIVAHYPSVIDETSMEPLYALTNPSMQELNDLEATLAALIHRKQININLSCDPKKAGTIG